MAVLNAPAAFSTRAISVLLAVRMTPASEKVVAPAAAVAVSHVAPLSSDTFTTSAAASAALRVPEMVWAARVGDEIGGARSRVGREGDGADNSVARRDHAELRRHVGPSPVSVRSS